MSKTLGTLAVGSSVYMTVNGVRTEFLIVHQGKPGTMYDASCDGTWLLMKDIYESRAWDSTDNDYANSDIHAYLNGDFLDLFDADVRSIIRQVKIPYTEGKGNFGSVVSGGKGLSTRVFLLSYTEVGFKGYPSANVEGVDLGYFAGRDDSESDANRIGYLYGVATAWGLRSPMNIMPSSVLRVSTSGATGSLSVTGLFGIRPALVFDPSLSISDDNDVVVTPTTNSTPTAPAPITSPVSITVGNTITISCGNATDPDGDVLTYIFERAYNGGTWSVVQSSASQTFSETALDGWATVKYRVKAQDSAGNASGYITGETITVNYPDEPDEPDEPDKPDTSDDFLQAIINKAPQDVRLEFMGGDVIGTSDIAITSGGLTYTEILNGETDVIFGRAVMSELSAVLINADGRFTNFDFSREFEAKVGVKVGGTFEYVSLGVFKGNRPDKVRGKLIDFTAHDRMSLFDKSAESFADGLTFPCTLGEIFAKLCAFCGVGYVSAAFPNSGKTFDENPLADTDYTCREILGYIAEAAGAYARMSRDGAVELVWFANTDYIVTRTDRFEMTESEFLTPPIDRLEVYNSYGDQLNTSGSGDIVYGISDNPFLYIENDTQLEGLQPYVDAIYNRITSLPAYHPSSFRAEFNPAVQCGDIISVVDDYGETIQFPVFVQTITWNGFGKTTYENTGGVIRQNAPFTQRELEQIKKKSVKTKDLWTYIDSYLSSEEGIASIETAVGGKFVTQDKLSGFVTETELNTSIKQYINGEEGKAVIKNTLSGSFVTTDALTGYAKKTEVSTEISQEISDFEASLSLSVSSSSSSSTTEEDVGEIAEILFDPPGYPFSLTSDGYYTSTNSRIADSYSYAKIYFNFSSRAEVVFRCISYGELNYDYGLISDVDKDLNYDNTADSSNVHYSFEGESSSSPVDVAMTIPAGSHYVTLKYIKDHSNNASGDYFKFRALKLTTTSDSSTSKLVLKSGNAELSSAEITFSGFVTFKSLETAGESTINGANVTTDNLRVKNIYFTDDDATRKILTSNMSSNGAGEIKFGFMNYYGNSSWAHDVKIYAKKIWFIPPGGNEDSKETLIFNVIDRKISASSANYPWYLDDVE